ncbi:ATP-binding protein [Salibacterium salarium]|nr:AAA family ATPase [Salibacterium salarium]
MKIEKLHIYGFGKFQDKMIDFHSPMHFIQGENEAGKSTIRAFIQAVLFGFPSKRENALRYEPKTGNHYGGSLTVRLENGEQATIERLAKRKAAGEVTVYTEDGKQFGEEWLQAALGNMDRGIFQGIFCFGLEGLSEIQHLKGEELNKYIYEAGMTGTKHIAQMEKNIEDDLNTLFKPKGQKPIINKDIKNLHDQRLRLREWEKQFEQYDGLVEEKEQLVQQLEACKQQKKQINNEKEHLNRKQTFLQFLNEKKNIEQHLESLGAFKDVSLENEEEWKAQHQKYEEAAQQLEEAQLTRQKLESKYQGAALNWPVLHHSQTFAALKERIPVYRKYVEDDNRVRFTIEQKQAKLTEKQERLGELYDNGLSASVTTISAEKDLQQIINKGKERKERLRLVEEQWQQQKEKTAFSQTDFDKMKESKRPQEEREKSEDIIFHYEENPRSAAFWANPIIILQLSTSIFFTLGIWEMITGHWLMGMITFGAGVAAAVLWYIQHQQGRKEPKDSSVYSKHKALVEEDQRLDALIRECEWQLERERNAEQSLKHTLEEETARWESLQTELRNWSTTYNFPLTPSMSSAESFFQTVKEWKELVHDIKNAEKEKAGISEKMEDIQTDMMRLSEQVNVSFGGVEETLPVLQNVFEKEEQRDIAFRQTEKNWSDIVQQINYYETISQRAEQAIHQLYQRTGTAGKDAFFQALQQKKKYADWENKLEWLQHQLQAHLSKEESVDGWMEEIKNDSQTPEDELQMKEEEAAAVDQTEQELNRKLAEIDQKQKQIEDGGTYAEELQGFEEYRQIFQENTHKWLVLKTAKKILRQAKSVYEKERQPEVIQQASSYFSYITQSNYTRLFAPVGEEKFIVEDKQGQWFSPVELSRGTAEQLYLSLRLALAENYSHNQTLPLIMDDPFVNFDHERQELAFQLLQTICSHRQIVYFTCDSLPREVQTSGMIHPLV